MLSLTYFFCLPLVSSIGLAHWGSLSKSPLNGHAQCISVLCRAYRSGLISCWHIWNDIELRLPWVGLCLSCKEICQEEIKFYEVLHGWGSHNIALIFQRVIIFGLISRSCKICNTFVYYFVGSSQAWWWEASEYPVLTVVLGLASIRNDSLVPANISMGRRSAFQP